MNEHEGQIEGWGPKQKLQFTIARCDGYLLMDCDLLSMINKEDLDNQIVAGS